MNFHSFYVGCFLALILSCLIPNMYSKFDNNHELFINEKSLYGSPDRDQRNQIIYSLSLESENLSFRFTRPSGSPKYKHCYAYVDIPFAAASAGRENAETLKTFIVFDCTLYSCKYNIQASFFQSRMLGDINLNQWDNKRVDFSVTCELIGQQETRYPKEIYWKFKVQLLASGLVPGAIDLESHSFKVKEKVPENEAYSRYIITPIEMITPASALLFSKEVVSESYETPPLVHLGPGYLGVLNNWMISSRSIAPHGNYLITFPYSPQTNPEILSMLTKQPVQPRPPTTHAKYDPHWNRYSGRVPAEHGSAYLGPPQWNSGWNQNHAFSQHPSTPQGSSPYDPQNTRARYNPNLYRYPGQAPYSPQPAYPVPSKFHGGSNPYHVFGSKPYPNPILTPPHPNNAMEGFGTPTSFVPTSIVNQKSDSSVTVASVADDTGNTESGSYSILSPNILSNDNNNDDEKNMKHKQNTNQGSSFSFQATIGTNLNQMHPPPQILNSLNSNEKHSDTTVIDQDDLLQSKILTFNKKNNQENKEKPSYTKSQITHIIKIDLNKCCSSQIQSSSKTECQCEPKSNVTQVQSDENIKSSASRHWIPFASFILCFLYFF